MHDFSFVPTDVFKLTDVRDHAGNSKVDSRDLYRERVNCIAQNIRRIDYELPGKNYSIINMDFIQDGNGNWINLHLRTSPVIDIKEVGETVEIRTSNSIYVMEPATIRPPELRNSKGLIELYLTNEEERFAKGYYYDCDGQAHELFAYIHVGMVVDTCLIHFAADDVLNGIVCRYYISLDEVEFYNTIYRQQDYSSPILIHNNSAEPMIIKFEWSFSRWEIPPWGEETVFPPH